MKKFQVTMVNPQQIAQKGLKGCKTTRQVTAFAQKFNVPWTWYKPTPNYRVMLVDWPGFRTAWKENTTFAAKNTATAHTPKTNPWNQKATNRRTLKTRTNNTPQKTTYAATRSTTPKAAYKNSYFKPATKNTYQANSKTTYRATTTGRRTRRAA